jgi:hypothetical protein
MPPLPLLTGVEPAPEPEPAPAAPSQPEEISTLGVPLGTLIFRAGLLTEEQLEDALQEGVRTGKRLGEVLVESGLLNERDLGRLLADQKGLRFVELGSLAVDPTAVALLTGEKAHMFAALPIGFEDGIPLVAVADPSNELVTENLRRALGRDPRLVVASRSDLHTAIDRLHAPEAPMEPEPEPLPQEPAALPGPGPGPEPMAVEQPVPVVEPEAIAPQPPPEPVVEQAPEPQPEPVQLEHAAPVLAPVVAEVVEQPTSEQTFGRVEEEQPAPEQSASQELPSALSYDVSLRLTDGERVQIGSFGEPEKAREYARDVVKHLSDETDGWPFFSGRFMRPDTIVSVDIVPVGEPDRWLGSSVRAHWASRLNR